MLVLNGHLKWKPKKVYYVSKAQLKAANKQYTSSDYEMTLTNETLIEECVEENDIPKINVNLLPISELTNKNANDIVGK
jgi:replication factor A1